MNTAPMIERLQERTSGLRFVGGALELEESTLQAVQYPAAFVIPLGEVPLPRAQVLGLRVHAVQQRWAVVLVLRAMRTSATQDQSEQLGALRQQVLHALTYWAPGEHAELLDFAGGELLSAEGGLLLWQDTFVNDYRQHLPLS